jgi:ADP-ribose pyrophosphatase YjhB (NUDIX family)
MSGMNRRISVRAVVLHEGKLLGVRLQPDPNDPTKGTYWCTPGGGLEDGEALLEGLHREMIEETGIAPEVGELLYIQQFNYGDREYLEFFFHVTNSGDYLEIDLSKTSHGDLEIAEVAFVDPADSYVLPEFLTKEPLAAHAAGSKGPKIFFYSEN